MLKIKLIRKQRGESFAPLWCIFMRKNIYIVSLGGSLIVPAAGVDTGFLKKFRTLIIQRIKQGDNFIIVTGGGRTARDYIRAADRVVEVSPEDSDWLGIHSTRLNAHLVRTILFDVACPEIITNPHEVIKTNKPVIIATGYRPGNSTDYIATLLAKKYKVKKIINLSDIDYVCDKDPKKFKDARKISQMTWSAFQKIVGFKWRPGLNAPFDPLAAKLAGQEGLEVAVLNGHKLSNLEKYLDNEKFIGTIIK